MPFFNICQSKYQTQGAVYLLDKICYMCKGTPSLKRCYNAKKKKKSDNALHRCAGIRVL